MIVTDRQYVSSANLGLTVRLTTLMLLSSCLSPSLCLASQYDGRDFHMVEWDIRSLPVLGFFPIGGNLRISATQISTYAVGQGIDLFNFTDTFARNRLTILNFSAFLIGLNYNALLDVDDTLSLFSLAYLRVGPHYRWDGAFNETGRFSLGGQLGYGMVIQGNTEEGESEYLHGIDVSFTLTYTPFRELVRLQRGNRGSYAY